GLTTTSGRQPGGTSCNESNGDTTAGMFQIGVKSRVNCICRAAATRNSVDLSTSYPYVTSATCVGIMGSPPCPSSLTPRPHRDTRATAPPNSDPAPGTSPCRPV